MKTLDKANLDEIFRANDIRGETPSQLDEEFYEALGKAFVTYLDAKKIAVGRDFRPDSQKFQNALIKGATETGCNVVDIGEISTEMMYFTAGEYSDEFDGALVITASHNPAGWNGCKMVKSGAVPVSGDKGHEEMKDLILNKAYRKSDKLGTIEERDIRPEYKKKVLTFIDTKKIKPLKIVVDAGNGIGGVVFDYVFEDFPLVVTKMYFEPDGTFPNHVPDPLKEENVVDIKKKTVELQADIGIAIDGDADRVFFVDNKGRRPSGAFVGPILVKYFLEKSPGEKIVVDPRQAWAISGEIKKLGGVPVPERVGHNFIKQRMRDENAIFAPEASCHFYYRDFYYADTSMVTIALMLQLLSEGVDFDEHIDYMFKTYPNSGEVNYEVEDKDAVLTKIEKEYKDQKMSKMDGISVEFEDWRFLVRPSNTQLLLRLNTEGTNKQAVIDGFKQIEKLIGGKRDNLPELKELQ